MNELQSVGGKDFSCRWRRFYRSFQLADLSRKKGREGRGEGVEGRRVGKDGLGIGKEENNGEGRVADILDGSNEGPAGNVDRAAACTMERESMRRGVGA